MCLSLCKLFHQQACICRWEKAAASVLTCAMHCTSANTVLHCRPAPESPLGLDPLLTQLTDRGRVREMLPQGPISGISSAKEVSCMLLNMLRGRLQRTSFSIPMCYFFIVFICKQTLNVHLCTYVSYLLRLFSFSFNTQRNSSMWVSKTVDKSEDPGGVVRIFILGIFSLYCDRTDPNWQEVKWKRERGGLDRGPRVGIRTRDAYSTTALYVGALLTRLSGLAGLGILCYV